MVLQDRQAPVSGDINDYVGAGSGGGMINMAGNWWAI